MAAVAICSDFGAQKNKVWHCFHCFHIYFPWIDAHKIKNSNCPGIGVGLRGRLLLGVCCCSVSQSCLTLWPHWLQYVRLLCPSLSSKVYSNSCPGVGDGQGGLASCSPWGCRVGHNWETELNWTELISIESVMPSNHFTTVVPSPPALNLSQHQGLPMNRLLAKEPSGGQSIGDLAHFRWPKYWRFSFNISPSNEYSGLISFRIDWFDLFAVWRTLKSLL